MRQLLTLLLLTASSGFAYTAVQLGPTTCKANPGNPGSGAYTCAFGSNVGSGNILVIGVEIRVSSATTVTVADTLSTSFTLAKVSPNIASGTAVWIYIGKTTAGGADTITVTPNSTYYFSWITMAEYDGTQLTTTLAGTVAANGTSNAQSCGAFTPTQPNVQVFGAIYHNSSLGNGVNGIDDLHAVSPMVSLVYGRDATDRQAMLQSYFMATPTSITPGATTQTGQAWSCAAIALQSAATPTLTSVSPSTGVVNTTVSVTLTGTNLTGSTSISAGTGITVSSLVVVNSTTVTADFAIAAGASAGARNVNITNPDGTSGDVVFTVQVVTRRRQAVQSILRAAGASPAIGADWSLVWITDQHPNAAGVPWVANSSYVLSKISEWNIQGFLFTGDIYGRGETWSGFATHGWDDIIDTGLPTIASQGNHDCLAEDCSSRNTVLISAGWDQYEGYQRVSGAAYGPVLAFSGVGNDIGVYTDSMGGKVNYAIRFTVNGHKFLAVALELYPRAAAMTWAGNLAANYPDHKVIYLTHGYIAPDGNPCTTSTPYCAGPGTPGYTTYTTTGQVLYDTLIKVQANSFIAVGGHFPDGIHASRYLSTGTNGNSIFSFFTDFQAPAAHPTVTDDIVARFVFHEATQTFDCILMHSTDDTVLSSWLGMSWT